VHIANWGVNVQIKRIASSEATIVVSAKVKNETSVPKTVSLSTLLEKGEKQTSDKVLIPAGKEVELSQEIKVMQPRLWDLEHPNLYQAIVKVVDEGNKVLDESKQTFGCCCFRQGRETKSEIDEGGRLQCHSYLAQSSFRSFFECL